MPSGTFQLPRLEHRANSPTPSWTGALIGDSGTVGLSWAGQRSVVQDICGNAVLYVRTGPGAGSAGIRDRGCPSRQGSFSLNQAPSPGHGWGFHSHEPAGEAALSGLSRGAGVPPLPPARPRWFPAPALLSPSCGQPGRPAEVSGVLGEDSAGRVFIDLSLESLCPQPSGFLSAYVVSGGGHGGGGR